MIKYSVEYNMCVAKGKWPKTKEGALEEAIRKWQFVEKNPGIACGGRLTCACCRRVGSIHCKGCLIADAGYEGCAGTPYEYYMLKKTKRNAERETAFLKNIYDKVKKGLANSRKKKTRR